MKHPKQVTDIVKGWSSKVDEKLAAEGIFVTTQRIPTSLAEWRLLFVQPTHSARLILDVTPVDGLLQLSWQAHIAGAPNADRLDAHRVSHVIGLCEEDDLSALLEAALNKTRPNDLTVWLVNTYQAAAKFAADPRGGRSRTMNSSSLPTVTLDYA